jgi:hypothetical protein
MQSFYKDSLNTKNAFLQTTVDGSQASNKETNNKQFEAIEQHAPPSTHVKVGD